MIPCRQPEVDDEWCVSLMIPCRQPKVDDKKYVSLMIPCRQPEVDDKKYVSLIITNGVGEVKKTAASARQSQMRLFKNIFGKTGAASLPGRRF